jgi:hypothetical protein
VLAPGLFFLYAKANEMSRKLLHRDEALAGPMYALAAVLIGIPLFDFVQSLGAFEPASVQWRFAAVGLLSSALLTPILGIAIALVVAAVREHAGIARVMSAACFVGAAFLIVSLGAFILDSLQLQGTIRQPARSEFQTATTKAIVKHVCSLILLIWMGTGGVRVARRQSRGPETSRKIPLISP